MLSNQMRGRAIRTGRHPERPATSGTVRSSAHSSLSPGEDLDQRAIKICRPCRDGWSIFLDYLIIRRVLYRLDRLIFQSPLRRKSKLVEWLMELS